MVDVANNLASKVLQSGHIDGNSVFVIMLGLLSSYYAWYFRVCTLNDGIACKAVVPVGNLPLACM
jgi:hypothetical protein